MNVKETMKPSRQYKDRVFRMLFSNKEHLLELYNALNNTQYDNPEELELTTWEDIIYMSMKNDVSMVIDDFLNLYEHQSTWNPNMALRGLFYFSDLYKHLTREKNIYSSKLISLPTPVYIVFYNGNREMQEKEELKLSDAFSRGNELSGMELKAQIININEGHNKILMERCKTLAGYALFVGKVKTYQKETDLQGAIWRAIDECIAAGVLSEFLQARRDEVMHTLMIEYDEERVLNDLKEEYYEDGLEAGKAEGLQMGELCKLIELSCKMKDKGYDAKMLADLLGEDLTVLEHIFRIIQQTEGEVKSEDIYHKLMIEKGKE